MAENKIKILHVAQAAGGVDRYIRMLLKYLDKNKFENILVCSQDFRKEDYEGLGYMDYVDYGHDQRKRNASWHVSCFSDADRKRVKKVLKDFRVKNYTMHAMIDDCIADFVI